MRMPTRDSGVWIVTFIGAIALFMGSHFELLTAAFPSLNPLWQARIELVAAVAAFLSGYWRMSPLAINPHSDVAGPADPHNTLSPLGKPR